MPGRRARDGHQRSGAAVPIQPGPLRQHSRGRKPFWHSSTTLRLDCMPPWCYAPSLTQVRLEPVLGRLQVAPAALAPQHRDLPVGSSSRGGRCKIGKYVEDSGRCQLHAALVYNAGKSALLQRRQHGHSADAAAQEAYSAAGQRPRAAPPVSGCPL